MSDLKLEDDVETEHEFVGKRLLFQRKDQSSDDWFNFTERLDNIGHSWNCSIKNCTIVMATSSLLEVETVQYGIIYLVKVMGQGTGLPDGQSRIIFPYIQKHNLYSIEEKGT